MFANCSATLQLNESNQVRSTVPFSSGCAKYITSCCRPFYPVILRLSSEDAWAIQKVDFCIYKRTRFVVIFAGFTFAVAMVLYLGALEVSTTISPTCLANAILWGFGFALIVQDQPNKQTSQTHLERIMGMVPAMFWSAIASGVHNLKSCAKKKHIEKDHVTQNSADHPSAKGRYKHRTFAAGRLWSWSCFLNIPQLFVETILQKAKENHPVKGKRGKRDDLKWCKKQGMQGPWTKGDGQSKGHNTTYPVWSCMNTTKSAKNYSYLIQTTMMALQYRSHLFPASVSLYL